MHIKLKVFEKQKGRVEKIKNTMEKKKLRRYRSMQHVAPKKNNNNKYAACQNGPFCAAHTLQVASTAVNSFKFSLL